MDDEFDWRTDVESEWEPQVPEPVKPRPQISRQTKWIILVVGFCLLSGTVLWIYTSLNGRVREAATTAESGALLAHQLLVRAVLDDDQDLAATLVARRPSSWRALNRDLVTGQLFFSRRPLGITVDYTQEELVEFDTLLAPELSAAEIVDRRPYVVESGEGVTETVMLERRFNYVLQDGQWTLVPLADSREFWGNWVNVERENVTLTYPARDEQIAVKLSGYLDEFLPQLCEFRGVNCPEDFHLAFRLETDPTAVRRLGEGLYAIRTGNVAATDRLVLPAPTLVGMPMDEAGYEALKRGYAGWIGAAIVAGFGSSEVAPADVLTHFDLRPPPAPFEPLPRPSTAFIADGQATPDQDVLMICNDASSMRLLRFTTSDGRWLEEAPAELWMQAADRSAGRPTSYLSYLSRLPDYRSAVVQTSEYSGSDSTWRSYLWREGVARLLIADMGTHYFLPPRLQPPHQPNNSKLAFYVPPDQEDSQQFTALLLDLVGCDSSPCDVQELPGIPVWSPGGRRSLLIVPSPTDGNELQLADQDGGILGPALAGQSPVWLDDDRFVYIARDPLSDRDNLGRSFGQEVMTVVIDKDDPTRIAQELFFDAEIVRQAIPDSIRPETMALWTVQRALRGEAWWFVAATGNAGDRPQDYVIVFNPSSRETRLVAPLEDFRLVEMPLINSTARQAVITGLSADRSKISVELIDAASGEMRRLADRAIMDWSADGQWLIQGDQGVLYLVPTSSEQQWVVNHDLSGCSWAVWIERQGKSSEQ